MTAVANEVAAKQLRTYNAVGALFPWAMKLVLILGQIHLGPTEGSSEAGIG